MKFLLFFSICTLGFRFNTNAQDDAFFIRQVHEQILNNGSCYKWLEHLSEEIGGRLSGSVGSELAIDYTAKVLAEFADTVYLQKCEVPYWSRGSKELVKVINESNQEYILDVLALGNSVGTTEQGISAEIIEVMGLDELKTLNPGKIQGKVVFFNRPMDPSLTNTFQAYGRAADQRVRGPALAAKLGAVAVLVRSLTTRIDNVPHTGVTQYDEDGATIPAFAISTHDANFLHTELLKGKISTYIKSDSKMINPKKTSYNVIAEIKGNLFPEEIILVGGHLDSWDVGGGAHDDGAGCVHSMQILETIRQLNYKPNRTIRCVLFMNEENGLGGGLAYAENSKNKSENHIAAIESDSGGFTPRGFTCDAVDSKFNDYFKKISSWLPLLEPYYLTLAKGGSGADINPLKVQGGLMIGFRTDSQRYFDIHHTSLDRIEVVNERELKLGAASMMSLVYLLDTYGL